MHLIYAVMSIMLVGIFSTNMFRSIHQSELRMITNEVLTELTGAGYDVLEFIGRRAFDENTDESKIDPLVYPVITTVGQLTSIAGFGGCDSFTLAPPGCDDIDDFDGVTADVTLGAFVYEVEVDVRYVVPTTAAPSASPTYAKEVTLTLTNPYVLIGADPLQVTVSRVFTYGRHTTSP